MLEGLELTTKNLKEVIVETDYFRLDSEFQSHYFLNIFKSLHSINHSLFNEKIELLTDGKHGGVTLTENGVVFLRNTNISENRIDLSDLRFISEQESNETKRAEFEAGDLLLTTIGTIGLCVKVPNGFPKATINQNLVRIVLQNKNEASLTCSFLNSKYGRGQLLRWGAGNVYQMINYPNLKKILIPKFTKQFSLLIDDLYNNSENTYEQSKTLYNQAENLLLQEINLQNFTPSKEPVNIKSFNESFGGSGRLDAEYYQPKYDELIETINNINHKLLDNIVSMKKSVEPGSGAYQTEGIPFIRVSNITKFGISQPEIHLDRKVFTDENLRPKKDTILLSKDGSVGIAYKAEQDLDVITSSALLHLTITDKEILPDYLTLVLNSKLTQMQAERDAGGSIIQHWRPDEIKQVLIPVLPVQTQQKIASFIQESFRLKQESGNLLEVAKQAVEIAIEQDEKTAMEFIKDRS